MAQDSRAELEISGIVAELLQREVNERENTLLVKKLLV
jgi:hypothetical protein